MKCRMAAIARGIDNCISLLYVSKKLNSLTRAKVNERKHYSHDTKIEVNVDLLPNNLSVLSHFQISSD